MSEEEDCPVSQATCIARMNDLKHQIDSLKSTFKTGLALATLFLSVLVIALRLSGK